MLEEGTDEAWNCTRCIISKQTAGLLTAQFEAAIRDLFEIKGPFVFLPLLLIAHHIEIVTIVIQTGSKVSLLDPFTWFHYITFLVSLSLLGSLAPLFVPYSGPGYPSAHLYSIIPHIAS